MTGLPLDAERLVVAEERRHVRAVSTLIARYPEWRAHLAYALLGSAVATCDCLGLDVEGFVADLRGRTRKPGVLVPTKGGAS